MGATVTGGKGARVLRRFIANISLAGLYVYFAYTHAAAFAERPRLSVGMMVVVETLIIVAAVSRRDPQDVRRDWATLVTAAGGPSYRCSCVRSRARTICPSPR
jgi:hypothetical protein